MCEHEIAVTESHAKCVRLDRSAVALVARISLEHLTFELIELLEGEGLEDCIMCTDIHVYMRGTGTIRLLPLH